MAILAIDTASRWTAIAIYDEKNDHLLAEKGWIATQRQTVELAPSIEKMMADVDVRSADLSAISVAIGPGSYTGLRIGLSVARGIALVHNLPIAAIKTHDIVAANIPFYPKRLWVTVEAGRKRVLVQKYSWTDSGWEAGGEPNNPTWPEFISAIDEPSLVAGEVPEDVINDLSSNGPQITLATAEESLRSAGNLARLGHDQIVKGNLPNQASLVPQYLRQP